MVMDEKGRNGRKWHLAQQLTYHVIIQKNNKSHNSHIMQLSMTQPVTVTWFYL